MSNAQNFSIQINNDWKAKEKDILKIFARIENDALTGIVMKSPVDTGRFRSNWSVSVSVPDLTILPKSTIKSASQVVTEGRNKIKANKKLTNVYIQNNLPYAMRLENGWSKQAPTGMVAITVNELKHKYNGMII
tara:strand:- start:50 stop:451 length:402 start_codon:yes stop_codon:yes gene_type:complete